MVSLHACHEDKFPTATTEPFVYKQYFLLILIYFLYGLETQVNDISGSASVSGAQGIILAPPTIRSPHLLFQSHHFLSLPLEVVALDVGPLNPARRSPSSQQLWCIFRNYRNATMSSEICIVLCTWFVPPLPIPASTELTKLVYISCRKKYCTLCLSPPLVEPGGMPPLPSTRRHWTTLQNHTTAK